MARQWLLLLVATLVWISFGGLGEAAAAPQKTKQHRADLSKGKAVSKHVLPKGKVKAQAKARQQQRAMPKGLSRAAVGALRSEAFLVQDAETGRTLMARNAQVPRPIASISKLMTAMIVLDSGLPMEDLVAVTEADVDRYKNSSSRLAVGTLLPRKELLRLALMSSENRAAHALARTFPGGVPAFVGAMNRKASSLKLPSARFVDPTGLRPGNVASPQDLAKLVSTAAQYPLIRRFSTYMEKSLPVSRGEQLFRNTNPLVRGASWDIAISKTGYTREAGRCLVMQAVINSRKMLIVLLDSASSSTRLGDALTIKRWLEASHGPAENVLTVSAINGPMP